VLFFAIAEAKEYWREVGVQKLARELKQRARIVWRFCMLDVQQPQVPLHARLSSPPLGAAGNAV
jgi:hypothetical protein